MKVAVIGAGAGGLAAAKALLEVGITPQVFEESADLGGLWLFHEARDDTGPAYRSLRTNTSKEITAFSDFPFESDLPYFPHRSIVEVYLRAYAARFGLNGLIQFGCRVATLRPLTGGRWQLTITRSQERCEEEFDAVMVATGIFRRPAIPAIPGVATFAGELRHSITYRTPEAFQGKRVLVVGLGSSAVDIATDLSNVARRTTLSTRRGAWIAPRLIDGRPLDHRASRLQAALPPVMRAYRRRRLAQREFERRGLPPLGDLWARLGIPFAPATAPSVTSDELPPLMSAGTLGIRPGIERFTQHEVAFLDGRKEPADTVILCTGYELEFAFLAPDLQPWSEGGRGLYRLVFPPEHPTLAFVGVCRVRGPIFPIVEMQARWAARVLVGTLPLPSRAAMHAEIEERRQVQRARRDSLIRVALIPYLDQLGGEIDARPHPWRHPSLLRPLLLGPPVAAQYRLDGPDRWVDASEYLRRVGE